MRQTHYVQVITDGGRIDQQGWTPWKGCETVQETALLAANKFLREAGYCTQSPDRQPMEITVLVALPADFKANVGFTSCHAIKMKVTPTKEPQ